VRKLAVSLALAASTIPLVYAGPASAASVSSCVERETWAKGLRAYVKVTNTCSTTKNFKIIWAFETDSPCLSLPPNTYYVHWRARNGRFDGLKYC
jgi:hypothetical protein